MLTKMQIKALSSIFWKMRFELFALKVCEKVWFPVFGAFALPVLGTGKSSSSFVSSVDSASAVSS